MLCLGWHLISTFWCPFNSNKNFSLGRHINYLSLEIWSTKLNALSYLFCLSHTLLWCPEASFSQKPVLLCTTPELTCPVSWQELMIGFLATRERLGSLQTQTVEMFVWRTINIVIHRERGTSLSFSRKKRWLFVFWKHLFPRWPMKKNHSDIITFSFPVKESRFSWTVLRLPVCESHEYSLTLAYTPFQKHKEKSICLAGQVFIY